MSQLAMRAVTLSGDSYESWASIVDHGNVGGTCERAQWFKRIQNV